MKLRRPRFVLPIALCLAGSFACTSCTVNRKAALHREAAPAGDRAERMAADENLRLGERMRRARQDRLERREIRRAARRDAREAAEERRTRREVAASAERSGGGGFFSRFAIDAPDSQYRSEGHYVKVDRRRLAGLTPSNSRIEIDLSEQRARVHRRGVRAPIIETQISTGKPGYSTPTGSYHLREKRVEKRSNLYGRWVNAAGTTIRRDGDSRYRPAGAARFIGADMPYWMRITGGIGMHIGYVPDGPVSHGCIRVPRSVQPLIFSKVRVGTPVTIRY